MATPPPPSISPVNENWYRLASLIYDALLPALRGLLHNDIGDPSYKGLPKLAEDLYIVLNMTHRKELDRSLKKKIIRKEQYDILLPIDQRTNSKEFDVTLIVFLLRKVIKLPCTSATWNYTDIQPADNSLSANVIRCRELRNFLSHNEPSSVDDVTFNKLWKDGEALVKGLKYQCDLPALLIAPLDASLSVIRGDLIRMETSIKMISEKVDEGYEVATKAMEKGEKVEEMIHELIQKIGSNGEEIIKEDDNRILKERLEHLTTKLDDLELVVKDGQEQQDHSSSSLNVMSRKENQENLDEAKCLYEEMYGIKARMLGQKHPETLVILCNLARCIHDRGNLVEARVIYEKVYDIQKKTLGEEHASTLDTMSKLTSCIHDQKNYDDAKCIYKKLYDIKARVYGQEHPEALFVLYNHARCIHDQKDFAEARLLYEKVYNIQKQTLGEEHSSTLITMNSLASCIHDQGKFDDAKLLYDELYKLKAHIFGREHPGTLVTMYNIARCIHDKGNLMEARMIYENIYSTQKRTLGEEHWSTLTTMKGLASCIHDQGYFDEAKVLYDKIYKVKVRICGQEHPETLDIMYNLARCIHDQQNLIEAKIMYEKVLNLQKRILGAEHSSTLLTMHNLASCLHDQGNA